MSSSYTAAPRRCPSRLANTPAPVRIIIINRPTLAPDKAAAKPEPNTPTPIDPQSPGLAEETRVERIRGPPPFGTALLVLLLLLLLLDFALCFVIIPLCQLYPSSSTPPLDSGRSCPQAQTELQHNQTPPNPHRHARERQPQACLKSRHRPPAASPSPTLCPLTRSPKPSSSK